MIDFHTHILPNIDDGSRSIDETFNLIKEAKEAGVKLAVGGKGMLLWQGAESYKLYTGLEMPTDEYQKFQAENEGK